MARIPYEDEIIISWVELHRDARYLSEVLHQKGPYKGIGKLMLDAQASFQVPIVFAGLLVLAVLGILLYAATALIEKRFTGWAFRGQNR